jgi:hypothetical protein
VTVVKKRGNARFFMKNNYNELTNPYVGTVIDETVVKDPG